MKADPEPLARRDLAWGIVAANWFLLGLAATFGVSLSGSSGGFTEYLGRLLGILLVAAIPVAITYIFVRNKRSFRFRLWLTICGWLAVLFSIYGAIPRQAVKLEIPKSALNSDERPGASGAPIAKEDHSQTLWETELAQKFGITPQEAKRRNARSREICKDPKNPSFVDLGECWNAVMAGAEIQSGTAPRNTVTTSGGADLPVEAKEKISGRANLSHAGYLVGNLYNGNPDWTVTEVIINVSEPNWFLRAVEAKEKGLPEPRLEKYRLEIIVPPYTNTEFSVSVNWRPNQNLEWNVWSARGRKN